MKNSTGDNKPIVFFDGYCNLCSGSVQFIQKYESEEYFYFASLQSEFVNKNFPELVEEGKPESVVLLEKGEIYKRSDAALRIARHLKSPWKYLYHLKFIPVFIRDAIYRLIARYRYNIFGKRPFLYYPESDNSYRFIE